MKRGFYKFHFDEQDRLLNVTEREAMFNTPVKVVKRGR